MTLEEARRAVIAAGYQGEPTVEILRQYGWTPIDPLANVQVDSARTPQLLKDDLALLKAEAQANNVPQKIIDGFIKVAGTFAKIAGI